MAQQTIGNKNTRHAGHVEGGHPELGHPLAGLGSPAAAVQRARNMLQIERTFGKVSDSLFDTIVVNEVGPATALAARMLGDYRIATEVVHDAFERARSEFSSYDGSDSPRSWVLAYVAEEAVKKSAQRTVSPRCEDDSQTDTEAALHCLRPERRLAVILTDVLGMTDEAAARIARVDLRTVRQRAAFARSWIARHLSMPDRHGMASDGAHG